MILHSGFQSLKSDLFNKGFKEKPSTKEYFKWQKEQ